MSFFNSDYNAYHRQIHGTQGDASPANSDTEAQDPISSRPSDTRETSAVLQGLRTLGIEHRHADDGPRIGRSSLAGSARMDRHVRREDTFHSMRRPVGLWRADTPGPHDLTGYHAPEHSDAEVTRHAGTGQEAGSSSAAAPRRRRGLLARAGSALGRMVGTSSSAQGTNPASSRRRARDAAAEEVQPRPRYIAGSVMQAEETTLPPPDLATRRNPHFEDLALIGRARQGLEASPVKEETALNVVISLIEFSAWLRQIGKAAMQGRLFTDDLALDAWKFVRVGGHTRAPSALDHLRNMESSTHGTAQIAARERRNKAVPEADRLYVDLAFGGVAPVSQAAPTTKISTNTTYRNILLSFSEWLASMGHPGLADPGALHSDQMTALAREYTNTGLPYGKKVRAALTQLRHFDLTGVTDIKRQRSTLNIPEADQRLIERFCAEGNRALEAAARGTGRSTTDKGGRSKYDYYSANLRSFSAWLQKEGLRNIASRLGDDYHTLENDLDLFEGEQNNKSVRNHRTALRKLKDMFSEAPEATIARIQADRFVNALGMFTPNANVADIAHRTGADEADLRVFLNEQSATGLTEAGQAVVNGLDGRLRQAANANIALRVQSWEQAAQHMGQMPTHAPSPFHLSPMSSNAFPNFSWLDEPSGYSQHGGSVGSVQRGTDPAYEDLSPLNSAAHYGSHGAAHPSTPSEVTGPSHAEQPLPTGPMGGSLNSVLTQLNLERGFASGDALNCLIDTALQFTSTVRRPDNGQTQMPELDVEVPLWRQHLFAAGVVPEHGMIDLYSANLAGANLAHNLGVRIQIIQSENGRATAHPVLGQQGPLVHILHTPGHFQPLWPHNG